MIELQVKDLLGASKILQEISNKSFKSCVSYLLSRIKREIAREAELFNQARKDLIIKYADKENGEIKIDGYGNANIQKEYREIFNREIDDLLNTRISLNVSPISLSDIENESFTIEQMDLLNLFIEE